MNIASSIMSHVNIFITLTIRKRWQTVMHMIKACCAMFTFTNHRPRDRALPCVLLQPPPLGRLC